MHVSLAGPAGPTIVTRKAKEAVAFYAAHFGIVANDYGAGDDCWYWTVSFGERGELSFMVPQGTETEFTGQGLFFYLELADNAEVDALRERLVAAGVDAPKPALDGGMYQFWITDPAGLRLMIFAGMA